MPSHLGARLRSRGEGKPAKRGDAACGDAAASRGPGADAVLALQRTAGNAAVARALAAPGRRLQRYTAMPVARQAPNDWDAGVNLRVADDGTIAVSQERTIGGKKLWATPHLISWANSKLAAAKSVITLKSVGDQLVGSAPSKTVTLERVEPESSATATSGTTMEIWADCGRSARDVMGMGGGQGGHKHGKTTAEYQDTGKIIQTDATDPEEMADEIMKEVLGGGVSATVGWARYNGMTSAERDSFDRVHGLNKYVRPSIGQGFSMASGGSPVPGRRMWNFHWAGVIMTTSDDSVTLENYAVGDPAAQNTKWAFQMYGPASKAGQTFHEQHAATGTHGTEPTTLHVRKRR
jgi:hypothetical protein